MSRLVSLTCDGWQAVNTNVYFAVMAHWVQESMPGQWTVEHVLIGFIQINTPHNGTQLGQALYKTCDPLNIISKVSTNNLCVLLLLTGFQ